MSILYHQGKANVVVDSLSRLSMGSTAHVEEEKKDLATKTCTPTSHTYRFHKRMNSDNQWVESSLVSKVKEQQDQYPILLELEANVHKQRILDFEQGGNGMLNIKVDFVYLGQTDSKRGSIRGSQLQIFHSSGFHQNVPRFDRSILLGRYGEGHC